MTGAQAAEKEIPGSKADMLHRGRNVALAFTMQVCLVTLTLCIDVRRPALMPHTLQENDSSEIELVATLGLMCFGRSMWSWHLSKILLRSHGSHVLHAQANMVSVWFSLPCRYNYIHL